MPFYAKTSKSRKAISRPHASQERVLNFGPTTGQTSLVNSIVRKVKSDAVLLHPKFGRQIQRTIGNHAFGSLLTDTMREPNVPRLPESDERELMSQNNSAKRQSSEYEDLQQSKSLTSDTLALPYPDVAGTPERTTEPKGIEAVFTSRFYYGGRTGTVPFGTEQTDADDRRPHIFTNGGRTGTVIYGSGRGAGPHGNQDAGTFQRIVPPVYDSRSLGIFSDSEAWVRAGTGAIDIERSWIGSNAGDQGNGYYLTPAAAARADQHERNHVLNCQGHYNTHIRPLLSRVNSYTPAPGGGGRKETAFFQGAARQAVESAIRWMASIWAFRGADIDDNGVGRRIDRDYLASGTDLVDSGSGIVGGRRYQHRVHVRNEPTPT